MSGQIGLQERGSFWFVYVIQAGRKFQHAVELPGWSLVRTQAWDPDSMMFWCASSCRCIRIKLWIPARVWNEKRRAGQDSRNIVL